MAAGVLDSSLIISLGSASALDVLWDDPNHEWHITAIVRGEVKSEPTNSSVSHALVDGRLSYTELNTTSSSELAAFARWSVLVDPGEAEAIAVGLTRGWTVGVEDLFAQRRLTEEAGNSSWINAATLLLAAVQEGRRSLADADGIFGRLDCYPGYRKRGVASLADLLN